MKTEITDPGRMKIAGEGITKSFKGLFQVFTRSISNPQSEKSKKIGTDSEASKIRF